MKLAVTVLLLALFAFTALTFNIRVNTRGDENDDKVKVDFYYESLCPYCQQFISGALKTAANTKVLLSNLGFLEDLWIYYDSLWKC